MPPEKSDLPPPPPVAMILPPEKLLTCFPINTSKGTKELFSSNHAIAIFVAYCMNFSLKSQEMAILDLDPPRKCGSSSRNSHLSSASSLVKGKLKSLKNHSISGLWQTLTSHIFPVFMKNVNFGFVPPEEIP